MSEIDPIYKEIAAKIQCEDSKYIPQILAKLANLEQARILRELPASSAEEIADQAGWICLNKLVERNFSKGD